jgi:hypothetical protein
MSTNPSVKRQNVYNWQRSQPHSVPWTGTNIPNVPAFNRKWGPLNTATKYYSDLLWTYIRRDKASLPIRTKKYTTWQDTNPWIIDPSRDWTGSAADRKALGNWFRDGVNFLLRPEERKYIFMAHRRHMGSRNQPPKQPFKPKTVPVTIFKRPPPPTHNRKRKANLSMKVRKMRRKTESGWQGPTARTRARYNNKANKASVKC